MLVARLRGTSPVSVPCLFNTLTFLNLPSVLSRGQSLLCAVFAMAEGPLIFTVPKVRIADTVASAFAYRLLQRLTVLIWSEHDDLELI